MKKQKNIFSKKMSSFASLEGSMAVEAALAIPLFLFFMITILSIIFMYQQYCMTLSELHQSGKELAMYGYFYENIIQTEDDMVELVEVNKVESIISVMPFTTFYTKNNCYMRAWTGYDVEMSGEVSTEEAVVYITETGTVYHRNRSCTYLNLSIEMIESTELTSYQNASGENYSACEICGDSGIGSLYYITEYGNRYHKNLSCSGLKRTITCIRISEVGDRIACSRCS